MLRRRLSFGQLLLATGLGVAGGVYIYRPVFQGGPREGGPARDSAPPPPPPVPEKDPPPLGTRLA